MKLLFTLLALICLSACSTPATVAQHTPEKEDAARSFKVSQDRAKVYFHTGKIVGNIFGKNHSFPADLFVDSTLIGSMNQDDVMVFDLKPGTYNFSWLPRTKDVSLSNVKQSPSEIKVHAGEIVVIRSDWNLASGGTAATVLFGVVGALATSPTPTIAISDKAAVRAQHIVAPQSCPPALCVE